jgi:AmmeMemoRadiSam system protein A
MSRQFQHSVTPLSSASQPEFLLEERRLLLGVAHRSILFAFDDQPPPQVSFPPHLSERRGVFTTLYLSGNLRGCVGYALPVAPLHCAVADSARAAAFEDTRFHPVTQAEAGELQVSLSVLSRLVPVQPEEVEVGRHGLVISLGSHRGLLLPQVPVEYNWDRETFLEHTCHKAGLDPHAWRHGATIEAFTAEVFGDGEVSP